MGIARVEGLKVSKKCQHLIPIFPKSNKRVSPNKGFRTDFFPKRAAHLFGTLGRHA